MELMPYLTFGGTCEAAMNFYKDCFGGTFESFNYYKDGPADMGAPEHLNDKIMHMSLRFGDNLLMGSDSMGDAPATGNITLNITTDTVDELDATFEKLSAGGQIEMPLQDMFWGARFGMFTDKYGIKWMLNCQTVDAPAK
jgi:PhnB protein